MITTPAATSRADVSLAGFGNGYRFVMRASLPLNPTNLVRYYLAIIAGFDEPWRNR